MSRSVATSLLVALLGGAVLWVVVRDPAPSASATCIGAVPEGRVRHVALPGRGYDVALLPDGSYVLATSLGITVVDPCAFTERVRCADTGEAHRLSLRAGPVVDYLRRDGSVGACDLDRGDSVAPAADALTALTGPPADTHDSARAWIEDDAAHLEPAGQQTRILRTHHDALDVAFSPDGHWLAVSDRRGGISLFTVPGGLLRHRGQAHGQNTYAVDFDADLGRILSVSGDTSLALSRWPPTGRGQKAAWP